MSRTLYLLRHGQTRYNAELRLQGRCNSRADPQGRSPGPRHEGPVWPSSLTEPHRLDDLRQPPAGHGRRRSGCVSSLAWTRAHHLGRAAGGARDGGVGESCRVPELLAAHPELDLEEPDWYLRAPWREF